MVSITNHIWFPLHFIVSVTPLPRLRSGGCGQLKPQAHQEPKRQTLRDGKVPQIRSKKKKISKKSFWSEQYALAQTTLKITVVCSCTYPSMHFHCVCRFNTPKTCTHVRHLGPCFKTGRTRPRCQERTSRIEQQLWSVNSKTWRLNAVHMSILRCVNAHRK